MSVWRMLGKFSATTHFQMHISFQRMYGDWLDECMVTNPTQPLFSGCSQSIRRQFPTPYIDPYYYYIQYTHTFGTAYILKKNTTQGEET